MHWMAVSAFFQDAFTRRLPAFHRAHYEAHMRQLLVPRKTVSVFAVRIFYKVRFSDSVLPCGIFTLRSNAFRRPIASDSGVAARTFYQKGHIPFDPNKALFDPAGAITAKPQLRIYLTGSCLLEAPFFSRCVYRIVPRAITGRLLPRKQAFLNRTRQWLRIAVRIFHKVRFALPAESTIAAIQSRSFC